MEESNTNNIVNNVARAIVAALDWNSTPDARKAAVSFLDSVCTPFSLDAYPHMYIYLLICLFVSYLCHLLCLFIPYQFLVKKWWVSIAYNDEWCELVKSGKFVTFLCQSLVIWLSLKVLAHGYLLMIKLLKLVSCFCATGSIMFNFLLPLVIWTGYRWLISNFLMRVACNCWSFSVFVWGYHWLVY